MSTVPFMFMWRKGDGDAKFNLEPLVELVESHGLKTRELSDAEEIIDAWKTYHS